MSDLIDKEVQKSLEPAVRLVIAGIFALLGIVVAIFQVSGVDTPWVKPNQGLWVVDAVVFLIACVFFLTSVRSKTNEEVSAVELRPSESEASTTEYAVSEALSFYDRIADVYDARLTREYLDTLRESADRLLNSFPGVNQQLYVLEIGAGTGQFLRLLEGAKRIHWTCIEPAIGMAQILRRFFEGPPLSPEILGVSLEDVPRYLQGRTFDAITVNFVISSLESIPDFSPVYNLLGANGVLIVSDGHPEIRSASSAFRVRCVDGIHALRIEHRPSSQVAYEITKSGLFVQSGDVSMVTKKGRLYSYVLCFRKVNSGKKAASQHLLDVIPSKLLA